MDIKGYKNVSYVELQSELHKRYADIDTHELKLAANIDVKSVGTIRNAFDTEKQTASDEVLTKVCKELGFGAVIVWNGGERNYYISTKN